MRKKTFLVSNPKELAEVIEDVIIDFDSKSQDGFKIRATAISLLKQMSVLTIDLVDGTRFNCMIEEVKPRKQKKV